MKTDIVFENLKVGQEVYSLQYGKGEIVKLLKNEATYPIIVRVIDANGESQDASFTKDGKFAIWNTNPTLFLTNPFEKLNQERVIEVSPDGKDWFKRVCFKEVNLVAVCWHDATTIEEAKKETKVIGWNIWRELKPELPAAEQPKEITIDGVEYTLTPKTK